MKGETVTSSFAASIPLVAPQPSRLPKSYAMTLVGSDPSLTPVLRKSATAPLMADGNDHVTPAALSENLNAKTLEPSDLESDLERQSAYGNGGLPSPSAAAPDDLALSELLEIISNRSSFHSFSKNAGTNSAYAEYHNIPRHHSSFEPRRTARKGHSHSFSQGHITYAWNPNPDELGWGHNDETIVDPAAPPTPTSEGDEDAAEVLDALIADLHIARTPMVHTPISASPIPRTQNPMPLNSPFFGRPANEASHETGPATPELYLTTGSTLVQGLLARQKALNTSSGASGRFVGVC